METSRKHLSKSDVAITASDLIAPTKQSTIKEFVEYIMVTRMINDFAQSEETSLRQWDEEHQSVKRSFENNVEEKENNDSDTVSVRVHILNGSHCGETYIVRPTIKDPVPINRSKPKPHLQENGISLMRETSISMSHGEFQVDPITKDVLYVDLGSSNGSYKINGDVSVRLEQPLILERETKLLLAGTEVLIELL